MSAVAVIDSGLANIGSVVYALQRLGVDPVVTCEAARIRSASRVILPGVGAAGPAMARLREAGLVEVLRTLSQPLLGICLGMQLLFERSAEGDVECLGLLRGRVARLSGEAGARVPHMGWNALRDTRPAPLLVGIDDGAHAYFVHSYAVPVGECTLAACAHGEMFSAVVGDGRRFGAQFHPERSSAVGAALLRNFLQEVPA
ncbi:MAG TPA: imidazole glycerol phosphate synthase subunit HisH [Lysobacter sp.]|nr:imidazole glycerol phosphate synthase subunit HisH [Lysobacter sp.]